MFECAEKDEGHLRTIDFKARTVVISSEDNGVVIQHREDVVLKQFVISCPAVVGHGLACLVELIENDDASRSQRRILKDVDKVHAAAPAGRADLRRIVDLNLRIFPGQYLPQVRLAAARRTCDKQVGWTTVGEIHAVIQQQARSFLGVLLARYLAVQEMLGFDENVGWLHEMRVVANEFVFVRDDDAIVEYVVVAFKIVIVLNMCIRKGSPPVRIVAGETDTSVVERKDVVGKLLCGTESIVDAL